MPGDFYDNKIRLQWHSKRGLPEGLGYDCKQKKEGKEAKRVLGSSTLTSRSCPFIVVALFFKGVPLLFFPMTIQYGLKLKSLHSLPPLILYTLSSICF